MKKVNITKIVLALITVVAISCVFAPQGYATKDAAQEKVQSLLKDVIHLDLEKYQVNLQSYVLQYPSELKGAAKEDLVYTLNSPESNLTVVLTLKNNTLTYLALYVEKGHAVYVKQFATAFDYFRNYLNNYKTWTNDPSLDEMILMLNTADQTKNMSTTLGNIKLVVSSTSAHTSLYWTYTFEGADYPGISISLRGDDLFFVDDRSLYGIGSTNVDVTKEDAIAIALKNIEDYSWDVGLGDINVTISDYKVAQENITAKLLTWPREGATLYPYWNVELGLDRLYTGNVYAISVGVWADNGEVFQHIPLSFGGSTMPETSSSIETSPQHTQSAPQQENTVVPVNTSLIAMIAVSTIVAIAAIALTLSKKKRK